jgi:hypothetical protein
MIKKLLKEEKGQSMVMVAVFLVVLIGFAGLAIDGGRLYLAKSQLQKAVDAGALAGADALLSGTDSIINYSIAETTAIIIAEQNYSTNLSYEPKAYLDSTDKINYVQVNGKQKVSFMLMSALGINDSVVTAFAKVKIGKLYTVERNNIIPIGVQLNKELTYGDKWELTSDPGEGDRGNYGFLDFSSLDDPDSGQSFGKNSVDHYIQEGSPVPLSVGDTLIGRPGDFVKALKNLEAGKIVYVPIVSGYDFTKVTGQKDPDDEFGNTKSSTVTILGFAVFKLDSPPVAGHTVNATFLKTILPGEIGETSKEYGTYTSMLIN